MDDNSISFLSRKFTVVDLFSGAGGTALGFKQAGFQIIAAIEIDPWAAKTYETNIGIEPLKSDIRDITPDEFRESLRLRQGELDVLVGCPPCQGFTRMRNEDGKDDPRNDLVKVYGEFVRSLYPKFVVFENVPGLIRTRHGKVYHESLMQQLEKMEYSVRTFLVDAADFGVPQRRKRVIILARRGKKPLPDLLSARTHGSPGSPEVQAGLLKRWLTVRDAIAKYPALKAGEAFEGEVNGAPLANHVARRIGERVMNFIVQVPHDGGSRTDVDEGLWLTCHREHKGHKDVYGRLRWDKPANVITSGCTNVSKGRFVHPEQNRGLTPREAAALQGFPDDFVFLGGMDAISGQVGNAVPPPLAKAIAQVLLPHLR